MASEGGSVLTEAGDHRRAVSATSAGILVSRVLGYVRDAVILAVFGAGGVTDAYLAAFLIPNLFRRFAGEGVLGASFVPIFAKKDCDDREGAERFASQALTYVFVIVLGISVAGACFSPVFVSVFASGLRQSPEIFHLTARLLSAMFPFLLMMSVYAVISGILNSRGRFGVPAAASALENISVISAALFLAPLLGSRPEERIFALAAGVLAGGILQALAVWVDLKRTGFRFTPGLGNPGGPSSDLREMLKLMLPTAAVLAVFQLNSIVNQNVSTFLSPGTLTLIYLAYRLIELPSALFGTSIGIVTLPKAAQASNAVEVRSILERSIRMSLLWMIPSAFAYLFFGRPLISLLFEYGRFTGDIAARAAPVLAFYAPGLPFIGLARIWGSACYAVKQPGVPLRAGSVSVICNAAFSILFVLLFPDPYKACGIGLGSSLAAMANVMVLVRGVKTIEVFREFKVSRAAGWVGLYVLCSLAFSVPLALLAPRLMELAPSTQKFLTCFAVFVSMGIYFGLIKLLSPKDREITPPPRA